MPIALRNTTKLLLVPLAAANVALIVMIMPIKQSIAELFIITFRHIPSSTTP